MNLDREERPKYLKDCLGMDHLKKDLRAFIKTGNPPNILFVGPPGLGKNTFAYAFSTEYLGREITLDTEDGDHDYMEINCSLLTGVDTVRELISDFLKTKGQTIRDGVRLKKILFLNEFEKMSDVAKAGLKVEIEQRANNVVVFFATNYESAIKELALGSRLATYRFKKPKDSELKKWFIEKANKHGVQFKSEDIVDDIVKKYKGDMRAMLIDCLEALRGYDNKIIDKDDLVKVYEDDTRNYAVQVFNSDNPKQKWISLWKEEFFDNKRFLEDYMELVGGKYSRVFAKIDSRLRRGCSDLIQMGALFDIIGETK